MAANGNADALERFWLPEQKLPREVPDSSIMPLDASSFLILHSSENLDSYVCHPFRNEYLKLEVQHNSFPHFIFDGDDECHEKFFDVTKPSAAAKHNMRVILSIGYCWRDDRPYTRKGNFAYLMDIGLDSLTVEYANLLENDDQFRENRRSFLMTFSTLRNDRPGWLGPIADDNDLRIITSRTLNRQHSVALNDRLCLVTGGLVDEWSSPMDLFVFESQSLVCLANVS